MIPIESVGLIVDSHSSRVGYEETSLWIGEGVEVAPLGVEVDQSGLELELYEASTLIGDISTRVTGNQSGEVIIPLNKTINRCQLNVPSMAVEFGGSVNDFIAGPAVRINCARLISNVGVVRIHQSSSLADHVFIQTEKVRGTTRSINAPGDSLKLIVPSAAYPWTSFLATSTDTAIGRYNWAIYAAGMELRRFVTWFNQKNKGGGGLRYLVVPMDAVLAKDRVSRDMFQFFAENGNLTKQDSEYFLRFDFSVPSAKSMNLNDHRFVDFLQSYLEWKKRTDR